MTAITRAQKLKAKRGRPRLPNLARTQSGRISRSQDQTAARNADEADKAMSTVLGMRERRYGATGENAKSPEWGYVLGRIFLDGNLGLRSVSGDDFVGIGNLRLEAGNRYAREMSTYYGLTGIPFPSARAQDLFAIRSTPGDETESKIEAVHKATTKMMALERVLNESKHGRNAASTVKNICLLDLDEARGWPPHMHEILRSGLDALVWKYGLQSQGAGK